MTVIIISSIQVYQKIIELNALFLTVRLNAD